MEIQICPKCKALAVIIEGGVMSPTSNEFSDRFIPASAYKMWWNTGVRLRSGFLACSSCGHLWASVAPAELRECLLSHGKELARQRMQCPEAGPYHDLPDTREAREAADKVAEIDDLMLQRRHAAANRRYRELMGTTWEKTYEAIRGWPDLGRAEKLARCGWQPKEKPAELEHPMRDRLLDG